MFDACNLRGDSSIHIFSSFFLFLWFLHTKRQVLMQEECASPPATRATNVALPAGQ